MVACGGRDLSKCGGTRLVLTTTTYLLNKTNIYQFSQLLVNDHLVSQRLTALPRDHHNKLYLPAWSVGNDIQYQTKSRCSFILSISDSQVVTSFSQMKFSYGASIKTLAGYSTRRQLLSSNWCNILKQNNVKG